MVIIEKESDQHDTKLYICKQKYESFALHYLFVLIALFFHKSSQADG